MPRSYSIVGMKPADSEEYLKTLAERTPVRLVREPTNEYDTNAIAVWVEDRKVGYIPKKQNITLASFIDQEGEMALDSRDGGKAFPAIFFHSPNSRYPMVEVGA